MVSNTRTGLIGETLQNEADCITIMEDLVWNTVCALDYDRCDYYRNA
jgi:hypothetical protein